MKEASAPSGKAVRPPLLGGRYVVTKRLGKGGAASVYQAYDLKLRVWRAVKVMSAPVAADDQMRSRFEQEAYTMARFSHPNVVNVVDVAAEQPIPYMVMELCEGGNLLDWLHEHGALPPRLAVQCILDVLSALSAAHAEDVIHRDVKPHNVLIARTGACKLTDFGIARVHAEEPDEDELFTKVGTVMGTKVFMSPEQRHDSSSVDLRADIYSAAASLYTFLTRKKPPDLFVAALDDPCFRDVPRALVPLFLRACHYKPEARYANTAEFAEVLRQRMSDLPLVPPAAPPLFVARSKLGKKAPEFLLGSDVTALSELVTEGVGRVQYEPDRVGPFDSVPSESSAAPLDPEDFTITPDDGVHRASEAPEPLAEAPPPAPPPAPEPGEEEEEVTTDVIDVRAMAEEVERQRATAEADGPEDTTEPEEEASEEAAATEGRRGTALIWAIVVTVGLLVGGGGSVAAVGVGAVTGQANNLEHSRAHLVLQRDQLELALKNEAGIITELGLAGANKGALESQYRTWEAAQGAARREAALTLIAELEQDVDRVTRNPRASGRKLVITEHMTRLKQARGAYDQAARAYTDQADSLSGRTAIQLGLVPPKDLW